jgi:hypothetical protein
MFVTEAHAPNVGACTVGTAVAMAQARASSAAVEADPDNYSPAELLRATIELIFSSELTRHCLVLLHNMHSSQPDSELSQLTGS